MYCTWELWPVHELIHLTLLSLLLPKCDYLYSHSIIYELTSITLSGHIFTISRNVIKVAAPTKVSTTLCIWKPRTRSPIARIPEAAHDDGAIITSVAGFTALRNIAPITIKKVCKTAATETGSAGSIRKIGTFVHRAGIISTYGYWDITWTYFWKMIIAKAVC